MLDIAELQVGFKPGDATLAVETLASINGKFVLNITKITPEVYSIKKTSAPKLMPINLDPYIFKFDTLDDFCDFCNYINNNTYFNILKNSSLTLLENNYYLIVDNNVLDKITYKAFCLFISDFANFVTNENCFENKLKEFGNVVY